MHTRRLFFWDVSIRNSLRSNNFSITTAIPSKPEDRYRKLLTRPILSVSVPTPNPLEHNIYLVYIFKKPNYRIVSTSDGEVRSGPHRQLYVWRTRSIIRSIVIRSPLVAIFCSLIFGSIVLHHDEYKLTSATWRSAGHRGTTSKYDSNAQATPEYDGQINICLLYTSPSPRD